MNGVACIERCLGGLSATPAATSAGARASPGRVVDRRARPGVKHRDLQRRVFGAAEAAARIRDAERMYSAQVVIPERRGQIPSVPPPSRPTWNGEDDDSAFSGHVGAARLGNATLTGDGEPERVGGARVSANFFSFLGVPIPRGRDFGRGRRAARQRTRGRHQRRAVARRYGADPTIVGRSHPRSTARATSWSASPRHPARAPPEPCCTRWCRSRRGSTSGDRIAPTAGELRNESWDHGVLVRLAPDAAPRDRAPATQAR